MRKVFILLLSMLCLVTFQTFGQSTHSYVGLDYTFDQTAAIRFASVEGGESAISAQGYRVGLKYNRQIKPKLGLTTGILLSQMSYEKVPYIYPVSFHQTVVIIEEAIFRFISVPVQVKYYFNTHRVRAYTTGGISLDLETYASVEDESNSGIGGSLGLGLETSLFKKLILAIEPNLKILSLVQFDPERYHQHLTAAGVQLGIYYVVD